MDVLGLIISLAFFVYFPIAGISSILLARRINDFGHQGVNPLLKTCWTSFTMFMMGCSVILIGCSFFSLSTSQYSGVGAIFLIIPITLLLSLTIYLEYLCYLSTSALNQGDEHDLPEPLRNLTHKTHVLGWIVLGLPLLLFAPGLLLAATVVLSFAMVFLVFVILGSVLNIMSVSKRANESELLWLLALCVEKNIPIAEELDMYSLTQKRKYREKIQLLSSRLYSGESLSDSLSTTPGLVPQSAIVAVRIGEESNSLGIALRDAAVQSTKKLKHLSDNSNLTIIFLYLTVVVSIQFLITGFIMYWIIPKFKKIFLDFGTELPSVTLGLMNVSDYFVAYFYLFLPLFSLPIIALVLTQVGNYYGWYNLRIPFFTEWFPRLNTPHCLRQIAQSVSVQKPPQIALESISTFHLWADVRMRTQSVNERIKQGENTWESLQNAKVINETEAALCSTAERMDNLPYVLRTLAESIELRRARKLRVLLEFLKPIIISFLAILVGYFVIALYMPLVKLIYDLV
ncbi:type II secretion system F family protein [Gimesia fumaroli]|uniref:Type II secretion system protein F n=1 Tax=Gimesia fumaroli TaxID=2527976 RepID=A0A518IL72_9PLAN|nr:type II secretion system F family protein [Gimesia fumaroli]QDV53843.1 Type II secretion system protein F [Gimesia fumaroli]